MTRGMNLTRSSGRPAPARLLIAWLIVGACPGILGARSSDEAALIRAEQAKVHQARLEAQTGLQILTQDLVAMRDAESRSREIVAIARKGLGEMEGQLRACERQLAKLRAPYELVQALRKYKDAGRTFEAFAELHRVFRGTEPSRTQGDYDTVALIFELEARNKVVVPVGQALVLLGELVVKLTGQAVRGFGFPTGAIKELSTKLDSKGAKLFLPKVLVQVPNFVKSTRISLEKALDLKSTDEGFGARTKKALLEFMVHVERFSLKFDPANLPSLKAKQKAYAELDRFNRSMYGVDDRAQAEADVRWIRESLGPQILAAQAEITPMEEQLKTVVEQRTILEQDVNNLQSALSVLDRAADDLGYQLEVAASRAAVEEFLRRTGGRRANVLPTSLSLALADRTLAADEVTALMLGLPRRTLADVQARHGEDTREPCTYSVTAPSGRTTSRSAVRRVFRGGPRGPHPKATLRAPRGAQLSGHTLTARGPFEGLVSAEASGVIRVDRVDHVCGSEDRIVKGTVSSTGVPIRGLKVTALTFRSRPEAAGATGKIDFFHGDAGTGASDVTLRPELRGIDGKSKRIFDQFRDEHILATLAGSDVSVVLQESGQIRVRDGRSPGKGRLQLGVRLSGGELKFPRVLDVTSNRVEFLAGDRRLGDDAGKSGSPLVHVPIGEEIEIRLRVVGGAAMDRYRVAWNLSGAVAGFRCPRTSRFSHLNGVWTATARCTFTPERVRNPSEPIRVLQDILDKEPVHVTGSIEPVMAGDAVYRSGAFALAPIFPPLRKVSIALQDPGVVKVARLDLFTPSLKRRLDRTLGLVARFDLLGEKVLPFSLGTSEIIGPLSSILELSGNTLGIEFTRSEGTVDVGSQDVGSSTLHTILEAHRTGPFVPMAESAMDDRLLISLNKLVAVKTAKGFRAKIFGPADLSGFTAKWDLVARPTIQTGFSHEGGSWVSEVETTGGFLEVLLLGPSGQTLARISSAIQGRPLEEPAVRIEVQDRVRPGSKMVVRGFVENLRFTDTDDFVAVWEVDGSFGAFAQRETLVVNFGRDRATMVNTLDVRADLAAGIEDFPVTVRVFRKVGGR